MHKKAWGRFEACAPCTTLAIEGSNLKRSTRVDRRSRVKACDRYAQACAVESDPASYSALHCPMVDMYTFTAVTWLKEYPRAASVHSDRVSETV